MYGAEKACSTTHAHAHASELPGRRGLLAGASAALLAAAAAVTAAHGADVEKPGPLPWRGGPRPAPIPGDDAELLGMVAEFHRLDAQLRPWGADGDTTADETYRAIQEQWWTLARHIEAIPAMTREGLAAKASIIAPVINDTTSLDDLTSGERLALALARDLGATVPAVAAMPNPDAELIALCNRIVSLRREDRLICIADEWAPDYGPQHARYEAVWAEIQEAHERIYDLDGPATPAGARAVAEAALFTVDRASDGGLIPKDIDDWLLLSLAEYHAGAAFEAEVVRLVRADNHPEARV